MTQPDCAPLDLSNTDWSDSPERAVDALLSIKEGPIMLPAENACAVRAQAAQVLVAAKKTAEARGSSLIFENPGPAFRESLDLLGLRKELLGEEGPL